MHYVDKVQSITPKNGAIGHEKRVTVGSELAAVSPFSDAKYFKTVSASHP